VDMGVSFGWTTTEYADYVDEYNMPIETDIQLTIVPIEVGLRINPIGRSHEVGQFNAKTKNAIIPYVGGGVGLYIYDYIEFGDYIDFYNDYIVYAEFESTDVAVGFFVVGGLEIPIGPDMSLLAEYKKSWVKCGLSDSFEGFDDFDLGGQTISLGVTMSF
ncbi:MAG: hypothetical protein JW737_01530, partial [Acidobacteria bacterium]|nr:hypothetical protein [Acidobacteriota bacterium]